MPANPRRIPRGSVPSWLKALNVRPKNNQPVWAGDEDATREHLKAIANEIAALVHRPQADAAAALQGRSVAVSGTALTIIRSMSRFGIK